MTDFDDVTPFGARPAFAVRQAGELPRSGMGVASLSMAIASVASVGLLVAVVIVTDVTFHGPPREDSPFFYLVGGWMFATGLISVVGIVFGIGGVLQPRRRHGVAAWGLCLNIAIPVGSMFLLLVAQTARNLSAERGAPAPRVRLRLAAATGEAEPPAWKSPGARVFQCLTAAMGAALFAYYGTRRRSAARQTAASAACGQCGKHLARGSTYCRRCGCAA